MSDPSLLSELDQEVASLKQASERLVLLAERLPKHGVTVRALSGTLLSGSQFLRSIAMHVGRDPTAAWIGPLGLARSFLNRLTQELSQSRLFAV